MLSSKRTAKLSSEAQGRLISVLHEGNHVLIPKPATYKKLITYAREKFDIKVADDEELRVTVDLSSSWNVFSNNKQASDFKFELDSEAYPFVPIDNNSVPKFEFECVKRPFKIQTKLKMRELVSKETQSMINRLAALTDNKDLTAPLDDDSGSSSSESTGDEDKENKKDALPELPAIETYAAMFAALSESDKNLDDDASQKQIVEENSPMITRVNPMPFHTNVTEEASRRNHHGYEPYPIAPQRHAGRYPPINRFQANAGNSSIKPWVPGQPKYRNETMTMSVSQAPRKMNWWETEHPNYPARMPPRMPSQDTGLYETSMEKSTKMMGPTTKLPTIGQEKTDVSDCSGDQASSLGLPPIDSWYAKPPSPRISITAKAGSGYRKPTVTSLHASPASASHTTWGCDGVLLDPANVKEEAKQAWLHTPEWATTEQRSREQFDRAMNKPHGSAAEVRQPRDLWSPASPTGPSPMPASTIFTARSASIKAESPVRKEENADSWENFLKGTTPASKKASLSNAGSTVRKASAVRNASKPGPDSWDKFVSGGSPKAKSPKGKGLGIFESETRPNTTMEEAVEKGMHKPTPGHTDVQRRLSTSAWVDSCSPMNASVTTDEEENYYGL
ncbi:hypothetical protein OQA88_9882 [Cercophora sp. LCS_1]